MDYILWKADSALYSNGSIHIYWYAIILIISYILSVGWLRSKLNLKNSKKAEIIVLVTFLLSFSSARLGYSLTYLDTESNNVLAKFLPFYFKSGIQFSSFTKLLLPAGFFGIFLSLWFCKSLFLNNVAFLKLLDVTLPIVSLVSGLFFLGNFMHSDIVGKPTDSRDGVVHIGHIMKGLKELKCCIMRNPDGPNPLISIETKKGELKQVKGIGHKSISINAVFKPEIEERNATEFIIGDIKTYLFEQPLFISEPGTEPIKHALTKSSAGNIIATINTIGIARYPVRFYLFIFCLLIFFVSSYYLNNIKGATGRLAAALILVFSCFYFLLEFITEQSALTKTILGLYTHQWYIIPVFLFGLFIYYKSISRTT